MEWTSRKFTYSGVRDSVAEAMNRELNRHLDHDYQHIKVVVNPWEPEKTSNSVVRLIELNGRNYVVRNDISTSPSINMGLIRMEVYDLEDTKDDTLVRNILERFPQLVEIEAKSREEGRR